eukprot:CAMPEP_0172074994 /NCGR_PEP_ID=MMETSP1043-20130122/15714_1 /TAXON_ID=464988 /ORGANISM="Hemiselmis andersenii, Strain CCMP441" /LENGTH=31 /DNA_ID= /DNA_START= /DNA_END= /DNA_ORIENTATION=
MNPLPLPAPNIRGGGTKPSPRNSALFDVMTH